MKIKHWMTKDPITIGSEAPITEAARIMKEKGFHRLPVVDGGRLVGLVTYRRILEAQPSPATTLSVHEIRYLTSQITVRDIMLKDPVTISPDDDTFAAIRRGRELGIGSYPVSEAGRLVGIITVSDLFKHVLHILGIDQPDGFVYLIENEAEDGLSPDYLEKLVAVLAKRRVSIASFLTFPEKRLGGTVILLRLGSGSAKEAVMDLKAAGYHVLD